MNNTINGRTLEEIKRGLNCCIPRYESNHWVTCSDECPYRSEGAFCRNVMQNNVLAYIQLLEHHIGELTEKVAQLEAAQPKWISVEDRLPDRFKPVVVCREYEKGMPKVEQGYRDDGNWWKVFGCRVKSVTHWMPFPEPPESVG